MKKNPNEDIITAIKIRQVELLEKNLKIAMKSAKHPSNNFADSMRIISKICINGSEVLKLQRIKRELEPKPEYAKGGMISHQPESILMSNENTMELDLKSGKCTGKPYTKIKGVAYVKDPIIERSKKCYGN